MRKKLEGNGLWESSRMMLPEHKERIVQHNYEILQQAKPELTEEEQGIIFGTLHSSLSNVLPVTIELFDSYKPRRLTGTVSKVDYQLRRVKIDLRVDEFEWVDVMLIVKANFESE